MVNGPSPGPAPADQARASSSRLTRSSWRTWPPPEAAQEGPQGGWRLDYAADGASRPAGAQHVGVVNAVSSGQKQKPPASSPCRRCWLGLGRDPGPGAGQPVRAGPDAGPAWLAGSAQHWPPGGGRQRRFGCGRGGHLLASFGCSWPGDGFLFQKPLSQMHRSTFLPLQHTATLIFSVDWGLRGCLKSSTVSESP